VDSEQIQDHIKNPDAGRARGGTVKLSLDGAAKHFEFT
jgi:hypothetical protein